MLPTMAHIITNFNRRYQNILYIVCLREKKIYFASELHIVSP